MVTKRKLWMTWFTDDGFTVYLFERPITSTDWETDLRLLCTEEGMFLHDPDDCEGDEDKEPAVAFRKWLKQVQLTSNGDGGAINDEEWCAGYSFKSAENASHQLMLAFRKKPRTSS